MDKYTIQELAYKKGYDKGYEDGKRGAAEVVRCKDCKYWNKRYETKGICMNHSNAVLCFTTPDFYCACGERDNDGICKKG